MTTENTPPTIKISNPMAGVSRSTVLKTDSSAHNDNRSAFVIVTSLFFMWGFITFMNNLLIQKFKADFNLNQIQANHVYFASLTHTS